MYLCVPVIVFISTFLIVKVESSPLQFLDRGDPCLTPFGEQAACISVLSCPGLLNLLLTKNETASSFAIQFQCGYDTEPLVCCRISDYPIGIFDIFTKPTYTPPSFLDYDIENIFPIEELPEANECGENERIANRFLSGEIADFREFPWLVALGYKSKRDGQNVGIRCGGSIINRKFVLTAAQCILDNEFFLTDVFAGEWKLSTDPDCEALIANYECNDNIQKLRVAEYIPHPFFSRKTGNNDIGLLKLANDIKYTDYIQPICLPHPRIPVPTPQTPLVTTGWETRCRCSSDTKIKQKVQMVSNYICDKSNRNRQIGPNQICAIGKTNKDIRQADPGGLLMRTYTNRTDQQTRWYQEGVSSWIDGSQQPREPLVFTRVSRYIRWIANVIKKDQRKSY